MSRSGPRCCRARARPRDLTGCSPAGRDDHARTVGRALFIPFDRNAEVLALALDRVHVAVELADPDDPVEERGVAVVVEDEVAAWRPVPDVSGGGVVPFGRAVERQFARKRRGLLDVVWLRKVSITGSWAVRSRAVALSSSRAVSSVLPKVIRIGMSFRAPAFWSPDAGLGPDDGAEVPISGAPPA
jgi:hypothetical protein